MTGKKKGRVLVRLLLCAVARWEKGDQGFKQIGGEWRRRRRHQGTLVPRETFIVFVEVQVYNIEGLAPISSFKLEKSAYCTGHMSMVESNVNGAVLKLIEF